MLFSWQRIQTQPQSPKVMFADMDFSTFNTFLLATVFGNILPFVLFISLSATVIANTAIPFMGNSIFTTANGAKFRAFCRNALPLMSFVAKLTTVNALTTNPFVAEQPT